MGSCPNLERGGRPGRVRRWQSEGSLLGPILESQSTTQFDGQAVVEGEPPLPPTWTVNEAGMLQFASMKMSDDLAKELAGLTAMLQRGKIIATTGDEPIFE